ncbi:MAG: hypothetical protein ACC612_09220 [Methanomethylovorans sp.]|uniref:hypothetical protein n=1 Tax=Methanomethylovorans sp. TaxID=2758717 RepID=UPI00353166B6
MNTLLAFLIAIILFVVSVAITAVALKYAISIQNPTSNSDPAVNENLEPDFLLEENKKEEIQ